MATKPIGWDPVFLFLFLRPYLSPSLLVLISSPCLACSGYSCFLSTPREISSMFPPQALVFPGLTALDFFKSFSSLLRRNLTRKPFVNFSKGNCRPHTSSQSLRLAFLFSKTFSCWCIFTYWSMCCLSPWTSRGFVLLMYSHCLGWNRAWRGSINTSGILCIRHIRLWELT